MQHLIDPYTLCAQSLPSLIAGGAAAVYASTKCMVRDAREKDDVITAFFGGCAAGATVAFKSAHAPFSFTHTHTHIHTHTHTRPICLYTHCHCHHTAHFHTYSDASTLIMSSTFTCCIPPAHRIVDAVTGCAALGGMAAMVKFAGEIRPEHQAVSICTADAPSQL